MTHIYIDESGDLGMGLAGSEFFIITAVKIDDDATNKRYARIPKDIRQNSLKKKGQKSPELKFSNSSVLIRERFLKRTAALDVEVYSLIIQKKLTYDKLKENLDILYNYLIKILLEKILPIVSRQTKLLICLDKAMSSKQRENFEKYIKTEFLYLFSQLPEVTITHEPSSSNVNLQVTDFVCGAFGYKYNTAKQKGDYDRYTKIIAERVKVERTNLFKEARRATPAY